MGIPVPIFAVRLLQTRDRLDICLKRGHESFDLLHLRSAAYGTGLDERPHIFELLLDQSCLLRRLNVLYTKSKG